MKTKEFIRQENNHGALLNVDNSGLTAYKRQRELLRNIGSQDERIKKIEDNIEEVKSLILQLIENRNNK